MTRTDAYAVSRAAFVADFFALIAQGWSRHDAVRIIARDRRHRLARHHLGPGDGGREPIQ